MNDERIPDSVRNFIVENYLDGEEDQLEQDTPLLKLGILDSLRLIELLTFLETECGVSVEGGEIAAANFKTLKNIAELVARIQGTPDGIARTP